MIAERRLGLKGVVGTIGVGTDLVLENDRIYLGYKRFGKSETFVQSLLTAGPLMHIHGASLENYDGGAVNPRQYRVQCDLFIGLDRNTDNELTDHEALVDAISDLWLEPTNWAGSGMAGPVIVTYSAPEIDTTIGLVQYTFQVTFRC